jgi:peptide/nickel transport system substrate-binding protein
MRGLLFTHPSWSRREFLKASAAAAGVYGLSPGLALAAQVPDKFDGSGFKLAAPEPNPKSGGVLRMGIPNRVPHFDLHQSGTFFNLGTMACMFDNLVRRDPRDSGKTIIPDLAHSWEISKDSTTYTFFLRKDVQFHDGAELTAEDVKATFDRIVKPPSGISIPRSILFTAVSEINARDKYTVEFKLSEPRPRSFVMSAIASGWNVIVRKKTLEDNNYNLRKVEVYPGTGPFRSVRRVENQVWVMEKNPNYWNKGLPYLDGVEFYHVLPFSPEMGSAILSGRVDYVRVTDPVTARKAKATSGMTTTDYHQSVIQATWVNNKRKPLDDPRVRRALHLVLDRPVLVDVVKDVAPMMVGGFIYPFSEFATPREELAKRLGYQPDPAASIKEARALMAAAGHSNGLNRFAQLKSLNLAALEGETLLQRRGCRAPARLHELCSEAGRALRLRPASDSEEHVQHLAAIELGLVLLPEHIRALPPLRTRPLADAFLQRSILLCAVSGRRYSPALDAFLRLTRTRDFANELNIAA